MENLRGLIGREKQRVWIIEKEEAENGCYEERGQSKRHHAPNIGTSLSFAVVLKSVLNMCTRLHVHALLSVINFQLGRERRGFRAVRNQELRKWEGELKGDLKIIMYLEFYSRLLTAL